MNYYVRQHVYLSEGCGFFGGKSCSMSVMATSVDVVFLLGGIIVEIFQPTTRILSPGENLDPLHRIGNGAFSTPYSNGSIVLKMFMVGAPSLRWCVESMMARLSGACRCTVAVGSSSLLDMQGASGKSCLSSSWDGKRHMSDSLRICLHLCR